MYREISGTCNNDWAHLIMFPLYDLYYFCKSNLFSPPWIGAIVLPVGDERAGWIVKAPNWNRFQVDWIRDMPDRMEFSSCKNCWLPPLRGAFSLEDHRAGKTGRLWGPIDQRSSHTKIYFASPLPKTFLSNRKSYNSCSYRAGQLGCLFADSDSRRNESLDPLLVAISSETESSP